MTTRRIHLIAPAGSCGKFIDQLGLNSASELTALIQRMVGDDWTVTGDDALTEVIEDEEQGGRSDDAARARDLERALADDDVAAIVSIRGGAWFARVLPRIDFSVLDRRTRPVAVFGFSELTGLVNIVGAHAQGVGIYDMGPAFLGYGLMRHAESTGAHEIAGKTLSAWVHERLPLEVAEFFRDVVGLIQGRPTRRPLTARLVRGTLEPHSTACFVGGNLTVLSTMIGSVYGRCVSPRNRWLVLEDFNDKLERLDRFLAHITLADWWSECSGLLLGDFHLGTTDLTPAILTLLTHHLRGRDLPILTTNLVGHVWPMSPLPLHTELTLDRLSDSRVSLDWIPTALSTS